jgi:HlyD family type I secretion membrane fusion protein
MANETAILKARAAQYQASIGVLEQKRAQASEEVAGKTAQLQAARDQLASVNDELVGAQKLLAAQLAPKTRVLELQRTATDLQSSIDVRTSEIASAKRSIAEIELQIDEFKRSWLTDIAQQLTRSQAELAELGPKLAAAEDELARTRIVAPASGQVVGQTIVTEGGVIQAGAKLLDIVPSGGPMVVEARLPLTDIGEVEKGAMADIRLLSTPARMRPHITGTVETISADRLTDERSGQAYYQLRVALTAEDVARAGVELQAGMPVEIVIPTRPRTMLDYLVSPLIDEISGSFRET